MNWTRWLHSTFSALHLWRRHPVVVIWHLSLGTFFLISDEFRGFSHVTFLSRYCPMHAHWCSSRLKATGTHRAKVCTKPQWWSLLCACGTLEQRCMCFHFIFNPFLPFLSLFRFECKKEQNVPQFCCTLHNANYALPKLCRAGIIYKPQTTASAHYTCMHWHLYIRSILRICLRDHKL